MGGLEYFTTGSIDTRIGKFSGSNFSVFGKALRKKISISILSDSFHSACSPNATSGIHYVLFVSCQTCLGPKWKIQRMVRAVLHYVGPTTHRIFSDMNFT